MSKPEVKERFAVLDDARIFAPLMREQDKAEYRALFGRDDYEAGLAYSIGDSLWAWVLSIDGVPLVLCGVAPYTYLGDVGVPWMVSTNEAVRHRHALMRRAPGYISRMLGAFPRLHNVVHVENSISRRWLAHMGFEFTRSVAIRGEPFIVFRKTKE